MYVDINSTLDFICLLEFINIRLWLNFCDAQQTHHYTKMTNVYLRIKLTEIMKCAIALHPSREVEWVRKKRRNTTKCIKLGVTC